VLATSLLVDAHDIAVLRGCAMVLPIYQGPSDAQTKFSGASLTFFMGPQVASDKC